MNPHHLGHRFADHDDTPNDDHLVVVRGATWDDYQRHLELRGGHSRPRLAYSTGALEITIPSRQHEAIKSWIGCLLDVWCGERGVEFAKFGSWTLENKQAQRGVEPDECYVFGGTPDPARPDLAIEVVWTSGGLDKRDIYAALGVRELWYWRRGTLSVHALQADSYVEVPTSLVVPGIDLVQLASFLDRPTTSQAIRDYRAVLAASR